MDRSSSSASGRSDGTDDLSADQKAILSQIESMTIRSFDRQGSGIRENRDAITALSVTMEQMALSQTETLDAMGKLEGSMERVRQAGFLINENQQISQKLHDAKTNW